MKRCPPPRMYNLHLQVYLFFGHWTLIPFDEGMQLLFLKLLLGELDRFWQVQTSPSAALFSCVSSSLQIEKCLKLKLSTEEQREALWSAVLGCYLHPPSFYCTNDRTTCSSVRVRMSHMTEVVEEDTGMSARSWGAMWGWGVEWEDVGVFVWNCLVW